MCIDLNRPHTDRYRAKAQGPVGRGVRLLRDMRGAPAPVGNQELWLLDFFKDEKFYKSFQEREGQSAASAGSLQLVRTEISSDAGVRELRKPLAFELAHVKKAASWVSSPIGSDGAAIRAIKLSWPFVQGGEEKKFSIFAGVKNANSTHIMTLVGLRGGDSQHEFVLTSGDGAWQHVEDCLTQFKYCEFSVRLLLVADKIEYRAPTVTVSQDDFGDAPIGRNHPDDNCVRSSNVGSSSSMTTGEREGASASIDTLVPLMRHQTSLEEALEWVKASNAADRASASIEPLMPLTRHQTSFEEALEWVEASNAADRADAAAHDLPCCPKGHHLAPRIRTDYRVLQCQGRGGGDCCEGTRMLVPQMPRYACQVCDFNVCNTCANHLPALMVLE